MGLKSFQDRDELAIKPGDPKYMPEVGHLKCQSKTLTILKEMEKRFKIGK